MKRILALIIAMALIFCFTACEEENAGNSGITVEKELTAEEVLEKSLEATDDITSVGADFIMDMEITAEGETVDMDISGAMEFDNEAKLGYMEMNMAVQGQSIEAVTYMDFGGADAVVYTNTMGVWVKQTMPAGDVSKLGMGYDGVDGLKAYLEGMENAEVSREGSSYKVVGDIGDMLTEEIMDSAMSSIASTDGLTEEIVEQIVACFEDIRYVMYIDADTFYPTAFEMDMSEAMNKIFESIPELESANLEDIKYVAKFDYRDYNEAFDITIPDEALASEEVVTQ